MTKTPPEEPVRPRLDPGTVVRTALGLLDEKGLGAVSIRGTADRLGVRMNTVLWHAKTKAHLLELMADAIVGGIPLDGLPSSWESRLRELAHRYRHALLARRDGAALVAGTYAAEPATLKVADTIVGTLLAGGLDEREAAWACWSLVYYVLGLTKEEQASGAAAGPHFHWALAACDYPALNRVVRHLVEEGSFDERFDHGLTLFLRSLRAERGER